MAKLTKSLVRRRSWKIAITLAAILIFAGIDYVYGMSLRNPKFLNGWVLLVGMVFLTLLNFRKKLSVLPIGNADTWVQFHIYVGFFTVYAFLTHVRLSLPAAPLEWVMWILFWVVALSGVLGAYLSRFWPGRLEQHGERILFERIPVFRAQLAREAESLAMASVQDAASMTISNFYLETLHEFFQRPRNMIAHLRSSARPVSRLTEELEKLERYVDPPQRETLHSIRDLVLAKDNLDYQYAQQGALKIWLFLHIPATYSLILLSLFHVGLVYAFSSGAP